MLATCCQVATHSIHSHIFRRKYYVTPGTAYMQELKSHTCTTTPLSLLGSHNGYSAFGETNFRRILPIGIIALIIALMYSRVPINPIQTVKYTHETQGTFI
jgi:hypothetical protein